MNGQSRKAQRERLREGRCPVHGVIGVPLHCERKRVVLGCPRRDCERTFYEPKGGIPTNQAGRVDLTLESRRRVGSASDGCQGYLAYGEKDAPESIRRFNAPDMYELIARALGENPPPGSVVRVVVNVEVVRAAAPSTKKCHNPWPAHRCPK